MNKIRLGIVGGGGDSLIGVLHRVASQMFDSYEIVGGVFNPNWEENISFAKEIGLKTDRIYKDFDTLIEEENKKSKDEKMQVVSVLTPNFLHYPMAKKLLENNFNVICEKPLTTSYDEAVELQELQKQNNTAFAVTYTYTGYPIVRQMKDMIKKLLDYVEPSLVFFNNQDVIETVNEILSGKTESQKQIEVFNKYGFDGLKSFLVNDVEYKITN